MADGGSGVKQFTGEMRSAVGEVAKDVKDSVGEAIEQGVQSVIGHQLTPQQVQQRKQEEQKQLQEARRKIDWFKRLDQGQKSVRDQEKQKILQRQQQEKEEKQAKRMEEAQRKQPIPQPGKTPGLKLREDFARSQIERSKGRGVGG